MPERKEIDWQSIRAEWEAGSLAIREIARQYGVSDGAVRKRAKLEAWPPRKEVAEIVRSVVRKTQPANQTEQVRTALTVFERCISLLHRHRQMLGALDAQWIFLLDECHRTVDHKRKIGRPFTLKELAILADIITKCAQALNRLIPLERRAFGMTDQDGPSEFDVMTPQQIEAVENTIRKALE